jgi:TatD DNase family protein
MIDTHAHPHHSLYTEAPALPLADYLAQAQAAGVQQVLGVACRRTEWAPMLAAAEIYPTLRVIAGVHPHSADEAAAVAELTTLATNPLVVGIGETGFDFYYDNLPSEAVQEASFRRHIEVALAHQLPIVVHTRSAEAQTMRVLQAYPTLTFVLHCFSGSPWLADEALALGGYLSFSGMLTFGKKSEELCHIAKHAPLSRVLIETDAPYLAPAPQRGQRNASALLPHTAAELAKLWQCSTEQVGQITTANAQRLFARLA